MTAPAHVLAAVRSIPHPAIPHPRQEPDMTAPEPSPAEQEVIDRFDAAPVPPEITLAHVIAQCEADIAYYGDSDDPMAIGRVIGVREVLHVIGRQP